MTKKVIYAEDVINQSLYKAASNNNIPPGVIIDFASIYGFQVDFQRDIQKGWISNFIRSFFNEKIKLLRLEILSFQI